MDEETQFRCAGYIQAEIERYSDFLADHDGTTKSQEEEKSGDESNNDNEDGAEAEGASSSKKKKAAAKKVPENGAGTATNPDSRALLEREYLFIDVVSTFLRAIRVNTIAVQHGAVLLSHYGRLGASFDACVQVVVNMIKDEGLKKNNGELVVNLVTKSLQEVCLFRPFARDS